MQQTPIEKAIAELDSQLKWQLTDGEKFMLTQFRNNLESLLPYEKTYHRNIAEKTWDASKKEGYSIGDTSHPDKQTYLNQNHPL